MMKTVVVAHLLITSSKISSIRLTEMLGQNPDWSWKDGEPIRPNSAVKKKDNGWGIEVTDIGFVELESLLDALFEKAKPAIDRISTLEPDIKRYISFGITLENNSSIPVISFRSDQMKKLAELGVDFGIDITILSEAHG